MAFSRTQRLLVHNLLADVECASLASRKLRVLSADDRKHALSSVIDEINKNRTAIIDANSRDCAAFLRRFAGESGMTRPSFFISDAWLDRMVDGVKSVMDQPDPLVAQASRRMPSGITAQRVTVPLGMVGILYKNRPRLTVEAVALCIKTGNSVLLDGGSALMHTNHTIVSVAQTALDRIGYPAASIVLNETPQGNEKLYYEATQQWLRMDDYIDLAVVSGSQRLWEFASKNTSIPLIRGTGRVCCMFIDKHVQLEKALRIVVNSKLQRPNASNAISNLVIHSEFSAARLLLIELVKRGVELVGDAAVQGLVPTCRLATEDDWAGLHSNPHQHPGPRLCVKTVADVAEAVAFIDSYSCKLCDAIVSDDIAAIDKFVGAVDSAIVQVNASTRFSTASCFGLGTDIAVSTSKVHSRGPFGIDGLCTSKWIVRGDAVAGSVRE